MNTVRKLLLVFFTALPIAVFSVSASAAIDPTKIFTLGVSMSGSRVTLTIQNVTPPNVTGNAVAKSIAIKLPAGWTLIGNGSPGSTMPQGGTVATFSACPSDMVSAGAVLCATGFTGLKAAGNTPNTIVISFDVTPSSTPTCQNPAAWPAPLVFTGNFSQTQFTMVDGNNQPVANVYQPSCTLSFSPAPPANVGDNSLITPPVGLVVKDSAGNPQTWDPTAASLTWAITPTATVTPGAASCVGGVCTFPDMKIDGTPGVTYALTAKTTFYGNAGPASFLLWGGTLGCDANNRTAGPLSPGVGNQVTYSGGADQGKWSLIRGNNYNTNSCVVVPYTFEVDYTSPVQVSKFIIPDVSVTGQAVAAMYTVVWGRFDANAKLDNMFAAKRPNMSWGIANPVVGTLDYVPALPCVLDPNSPDFSGTGKLFPNGFVSVSTTDLDRLLPVIPDAYPYNTLASDPRRSQFATGKKARMCVTQQGWTAVGTDFPGDPLNVSLPLSPIMFQQWTTVIDQADGFMNVE
jgi:hypothetical protein